MVNSQDFKQISLPGMEAPVVVLPKLKPLHEQFCRQYVLKNNDGKAAYLAVYPHVSPESAKVLACKLLKKDAIAGYIAAFRVELREQLAAGVINYHRQVLTTDRRLFLDQFGHCKPLEDLSEDAAAILEFEQVSAKDGVRTLLKVPQRHQSAVELAKILGLQKAQVDIPGGTAGNVVVSITL